MIKKILLIIFKLFLIIFSLGTILFVFVNIPVFRENSEAKFGVTFSLRYARDIGLDWKEVYLAMFDDLKIKKVRIPVYWDSVENEEGKFEFSDLDWQIEQARKRDVELILVVGQKVPRWPECYIPEYLKNNDVKRKENLLKFIEVVVSRYKDNKAIHYWQVENEPFLKFGECPEFDVDLLDREIALVKKIDPSRKIIITDSGELSTWIPAAKRADLFGTTMYRNVYKEGFGYYVYPIGPRFFHLKYWLIKFLVKQENAIVVELQAEPWIAGWTTSQPLEEQFKSMNNSKLLENVTFAKQVGFPEIYLWGVEWWYWLKNTQNHPELWETAKTIFKI